MNEWEKWPVSGDLKYDDPAWDNAEAKASAKHGVPVEVLRTIRTVGEKSNYNQVSRKGAKGVYQFMPATRDLFKKAYGVDAYGPTADEQSEAAALHLKESYNRTKDWNKAMAGFNGGPSAERGTNTHPENVAYASRTSAALGAAPSEDWKNWPEAGAPTTPVNPGHAARIKKMEGSEPAITSGGQVAAGATRYLTGRVLPAVEDFVRGRVGSQPGSLDPFTKKPQSYLTQGITDWGEQNYQKNKGTLADLSEAGAAGLGGMVGPGGAGKAKALVNFLRSVGSAGGQELALAPQPGDTRAGNALQAGAGAGVAHGVLAPVRKAADWLVRSLRGTSGVEKEAGERLVKAGGRNELGQSLDDLAESQSGVVMSPASRMELPKVANLESQERRLNPKSFQKLDETTTRSADTIKSAADDKLYTIDAPSPMDKAAHRRTVAGVERDVAKAEALKESADTEPHVFNKAMKVANNLLEHRGVGTVADLAGSGKGLHVARATTRILQYVRLAPKGNVELANALADPSGDALRKLIDKYDKTLSDETKTKVIQNLLSRQAGAAGSTAANNR